MTSVTKMIPPRIVGAGARLAIIRMYPVSHCTDSRDSASAIKSCQKPLRKSYFVINEVMMVAYIQMT